MKLFNCLVTGGLAVSIAGCVLPEQLVKTTSIYSESSDGLTIRDKKTGLEWMRCTLGQKWNGSQCTGKPDEYTLDEAYELVKRYKYAGYSDWRLPNINELKTLVYCSSKKREDFAENKTGGGCAGKYSSPTILESTFPDTPASSVWSISIAS